MAAPKSPPSTTGTVKDVVRAIYAGWANGISAAQVAKQVYEERGA
jgi:alkylhydroperoxidase/carboxymuconolactone decarboxylase family protein YurZ